MDLYLSSLLLGVIGLGVMAVGGLGGHGHSHGYSHGGNGHGGQSHSGQGHDAHDAHGHHELGSFLWTVASPRFLFSIALGFGIAGLLLRGVTSGPLLLAAAFAGGVLFERLIVMPVWRFAMRFASNPAVTLESAVADEATAVTSFDANGQGIISVEVDGQVVQILATMRASDRQLGGRVRAGQRVRIEEVDSSRNCCTVSLL